MTGLRSENGRSIKWEQVDLEKKSIFVPKTKTTNDQLLPLSEAALKVIKEQIGLNEKFVFPSHYADKHIIELRDHFVPLRAKYVIIDGYHIRPVSGLHVSVNLRPMLRPRNQSKGNRFDSDIASATQMKWLRKRGLTVN